MTLVVSILTVIIHANMTVTIMIIIIILSNILIVSISIIISALIVIIWYVTAAPHEGSRGEGPEPLWYCTKLKVP